MIFYGERIVFYGKSVISYWKMAEASTTPAAALASKAIDETTENLVHRRLYIFILPQKENNSSLNLHEYCSPCRPVAKDYEGKTYATCKTYVCFSMNFMSFQSDARASCSSTRCPKTHLFVLKPVVCGFGHLLSFARPANGAKGSFEGTRAHGCQHSQVSLEPSTRYNRHG